MNSDDIIQIKDHLFVLIGYTYFPDKKADLTRQIEALGGRVEDALTEHTHYLVLSRDDQDEWRLDMDQVDFLMDHGALISMTFEDQLCKALVQVG
jgi:hypothetical protein